MSKSGFTDDKIIELERKRIILNLESQMKKYQRMINHTESYNAKLFLMKNLKTHLAFLKVILPYLVTASVTFKIFSCIGMTPFVYDDKKENLRIRKEFDNKGNEKQVFQYTNFESTLSTVSFYGKWDLNEDGLYERLVSVYRMPKIDEETIKNIIKSGDATSLDDLFKEKISERREVKNNINYKELESDGYFEAVIYDVDNNDCIMVKQDFNSDLIDIIIWLLDNCFLGYLINKLRKKISDYSFEEALVEIEKDYQKIDKDELVRRLKITKDNLSRLKEN